jgi:uncharacterized Zn finger protein
MNVTSKTTLPASSGKKNAPRRGRPPGIRTCAEFEAPRWWTEGFINNIGNIAAQKQINAAKNYVRGGHVIELCVSPGLIEAKVQGRRKAPYRVRLHSTRLSVVQIEEIKSKLMEKSIYRATLLSGDIPRELDAIFKASGVPLSLEKFTRSQQLCSCSEPENVCKHILAAVYVAAVAFDRDPFLLMKMRGLEKDDLLTSLCAPVGASAPSTPPLDADWSVRDCPGRRETNNTAAEPAVDETFYGSKELSDELNELERRVSDGGTIAPMPDFPLWRGEASFSESIAPYYRCVEKFVSGK